MLLLMLLLVLVVATVLLLLLLVQLLLQLAHLSQLLSLPLLVQSLGLQQAPFIVAIEAFRLLFSLLELLPLPPLLPSGRLLSSSSSLSPPFALSILAPLSSSTCSVLRTTCVSMRRRLLLHTDLVVVVRVGSLHNVVVLDGDALVVVHALALRRVLSSVDLRVAQARSL